MKNNCTIVIPAPVLTKVGMGAGMTNKVLDDLNLEVTLKPYLEQGNCNPVFYRKLSRSCFDIRHRLKSVSDMKKPAKAD